MPTALEKIPTCMHHNKIKFERKNCSRIQTAKENASEFFSRKNIFLFVPTEDLKYLI